MHECVRVLVVLYSNKCSGFLRQHKTTATTREHSDATLTRSYVCSVGRLPLVCCSCCCYCCCRCWCPRFGFYIYAREPNQRACARVLFLVSSQDLRAFTERRTRLRRPRRARWLMWMWDVLLLLHARCVEFRTHRTNLDQKTPGRTAHAREYAIHNAL